MKKLSFLTDDNTEVNYYIVGQTVLEGTSYLLVSEEEGGDADALILKAVTPDKTRNGTDGGADSADDTSYITYETVTDDAELAACAKAFSGLLGEEDIYIEL